MDTIVVRVKPYEGRYEFDKTRLTATEWGWIKRLCGYLPDAFEDRMPADPELIVLFATMAMRRNGKIDAARVPDVYRELADADFDGNTISWELEPDEDDAGPPGSSTNGSTASSGAGSPTTSVSPAPTPSATGPPSSGTSVSDPLMSVT